MAINLTGMASGLDTEAIVSQLMAMEQTKVTAVQRRQSPRSSTRTTSARSSPDSTRSRPGTPRCSRHTIWKPSQSTTSSDPAKIDVSPLGGAGIGGHSILVNKLASSAQHGFEFTRRGHRRQAHAPLRRDPNAGRHSQGRDRRRRQRDRDRRRHGDQRQRGLARVRRGGQGGRGERLIFSARKTGETPTSASTPRSSPAAS